MMAKRRVWDDLRIDFMREKSSYQEEMLGQLNIVSWMQALLSYFFLIKAWKHRFVRFERVVFSNSHKKWFFSEYYSIFKV